MSVNITLKNLCDKYTPTIIKEYIQKYSDKLVALTKANQQFMASQSENNNTESDKLVADITKATQSYYSFIAQLPDDIKSFLLNLNEETPIDTGQLERMGIVFDKGININNSVLFTMQSIRPKLYTMQLDAISQQLPELLEETQLDVKVEGNKPVITSVTLNMPENMELEGGVTLSTYDKSIINGVNSLMESGNTAFSIPMLYHAMTGKQNPTVDDQLQDEISEKLENMRRMTLSIDLTEEARAKYLLDEFGEPLDVEELSIEGYLLPLNKITGVVNGKKTILYQMIQPPPLYTYSKMKRQLATAPINLLNAPVSNNATTIPLKTYLLQRIEVSKNTQAHNNTINILYESVYQELGAEDKSKTQKMRIRRYTTTILDYYIEKNYISNYLEYKEGRSIKGVRVDL